MIAPIFLSILLPVALLHGAHGYTWGHLLPKPKPGGTCKFIHDNRINNFYNLICIIFLFLQKYNVKS